MSDPFSLSSVSDINAECQVAWNDFLDSVHRFFLLQNNYKSDKYSIENDQLQFFDKRLSEMENSIKSIDSTARSEIEKLDANQSSANKEQTWQDKISKQIDSLIDAHSQSALRQAAIEQEIEKLRLLVVKANSRKKTSLWQKISLPSLSLDDAVISASSKILR